MPLPKVRAQGVTLMYRGNADEASIAMIKVGALR
jgi:hypothetical protein